MSFAQALESRKAQRYDLRLPLKLVRCGHVESDCQGETRNLSSKGVLFSTKAKFRIGESLEYVIKLPTASRGGGRAQLFCLGKVVRLSRNAEVAVTLERYEFLPD